MADPKLKEAMAEIMGILEKHDIAGQVVLASPTHAEFRTRFNPTWSCAVVTEEGLRMRAIAEELGSKEAVNQTLEATVHMFSSFRDISMQHFVAYEKLLHTLSEHIPIEYGEAEFEPHLEN